MNDKFFELANKIGWNADTQVTMLLEYIERQQSDEAFENYLSEIKELDEQDSEN